MFTANFTKAGQCLLPLFNTCLYDLPSLLGTSHAWRENSKSDPRSRACTIAF